MRTLPASPAAFVSCCSWVCNSLVPFAVQDGRGAPSGLTLWQTKTWRSNAGNLGSPSKNPNTKEGSNLGRAGNGASKPCLPGLRLAATRAEPAVSEDFSIAQRTPTPICENNSLTMSTDNLLSLKDDMVAFIEGHGLKRLPGYVTEEIPSIVWEGHDNPDAWKDFVEMAKHVGAPFVTFSEMTLEREELDALIEEAGEMNFPDEEATEVVEAQWLRKYAGNLGYIQLGFVYQGLVFLHETTTEWYERFQALLEDVETFQDIVIDDHEHDDEDE